MAIPRTKLIQLDTHATGVKTFRKGDTWGRRKRIYGVLNILGMGLYTIVHIRAYRRHKGHRNAKGTDTYYVYCGETLLGAKPTLPEAKLLPATRGRV